MCGLSAESPRPWIEHDQPALDTELLQRLAAEGSAFAEMLLISMIINSQVQGTSPEAGYARWFALVEEEDPLAIYLLASLYLGGDEYVPLNEEEACRLFARGARLGSVSMKGLYGGCLLMGLGGIEDVDKGIELLRTAASGGVPEAMYLVGAYEADMQENLSKALLWWRRAARLGDADAQDELRDRSEAW